MVCLVVEVWLLCGVVYKTACHTFTGLQQTSATLDCLLLMILVQFNLHTMSGDFSVYYLLHHCHVHQCLKSATSCLWS